MFRRVLSATLFVPVVAGLLHAVPASAADGATVGVADANGKRELAASGPTTLNLAGNGFQVVKNGHGGVYVFFGTVDDGWQPSKGGVSGVDYRYVPDAEEADNQGYQKYVAFPGSDTADSANGGVMRADGSWNTILVVPGPTFTATGRDGESTEVDCRVVTCGVITVGAHGVDNARNETFTPVKVAGAAAMSSTPASTSSAGAAPAVSTPSVAPTSQESSTPLADPTATGPVVTTTPTATLEVDRASAVAGNVLAFAGSGLTPGSQVSAVFDNGAAGAGPFLVGSDGSVSGVVTLPADTSAGTHELRLYGVGQSAVVQFAVRAAAGESDGSTVPLIAWIFIALAAVAVLAALLRLALARRAVGRRPLPRPRLRLPRRRSGAAPATTAIDSEEIQ